MGVTNRYLIDIVDSIATKINGVPADTVHRPFKTEIIKAVNEDENSIILDRPQYDFLRKTSKLKGWQKGTGQTVKQLQWSLSLIRSQSRQHRHRPALLLCQSQREQDYQ